MVADTEPEYLEVAQPLKSKKEADYSLGRMRRFVSHLSVASRRAEDRLAKKDQIKKRLENIKKVSLNKRSTKAQIENELGSFEDVVHDVIKDEDKILEEQRKETRQIGELRKMVENLSTKLIEIGREYAAELEEKDSKILELREALASAHIKISESGEERKKKINDIERKIKRKQDEPPKPKTKEDHIAELESQLKTLESRHKDLRKKGKHSKKDLDRVKKLIDKHKATIKKAKSKK